MCKEARALVSPVLKRTSPPMISPEQFRQFGRHFPTGVAVVTTCDEEGNFHGLTMNAFASVSLKPPLYLLCVDNNSYTLPSLLKSRSFGLNILREDQEWIAKLFASKRADKFQHRHFKQGKSGVPLLVDAVGWIECRVTNVFPGGDHRIIIGHVIYSVINGGKPLLSYGGDLLPLSVDKVLSQ